MKQGASSAGWGPLLRYQCATTTVFGNQRQAQQVQKDSNHSLSPREPLAKGPAEARERALAQLQTESAKAPPLVKLAPFAQDLSNLIDGFKQAEANRRAATTALAVERYRLQHGRWPDSLEALVAAQLLRQVPIDPYDGKPLRYRATKDGVVLYSIGPDGKGDGNASDRHTFARGYVMLEFQLWNVDQRRQPQQPQHRYRTVERPGPNGERLPVSSSIP
jgi:hypothetical protein